MPDESLILQKADLHRRRAQLSSEKRALLEKRLRGERENVSRSTSLLVPLQRGDGKKQPLFFVHPIGGGVGCYMDLVRQLDPHRTYYGLQAQGLDGKQPPLTRVEDLAQCYSTLVHNLQPEGPYWLAGWSMGGVIAFEMAQQLKAQHQPVGLLALIDAYLPDNQAMPQTDEIWFLANLVLSSGLPLNVNLSLEVVDLLQARFAPLLPHERLSAMWSYLKQAKVALPDMDLSQVHHLFDIFQSNTQALQCYTPRDYSSPIVLFQAGEHLLAMQREAVDSGWRTLVQGELAVHTLPGNHYSLLRKPAVEILAEQLRSYLQG